MFISLSIFFFNVIYLTLPIKLCAWIFFQLFFVNICMYIFADAVFGFRGFTGRILLQQKEGSVLFSYHFPLFGSQENVGIQFVFLILTTCFCFLDWTLISYWIILQKKHVSFSFFLILFFAFLFHMLLKKENIKKKLE